MRIRKKEPSVGIIGKIVNSFTNSKNDTYSADYLNNELDKKGDLTTHYANGVTTSINDLKTNGKWRIFISTTDDDAKFLGFGGNLIVETFVQASNQPTIQRITQMATGKTIIRYCTTDNFSYSDTLYSVADEAIKYAKEKNILTAYLDTDYTIITADSYEQLNLKQASKIGDKLSIINGGIKIGKGVSKILVNYDAIFSSLAQTGQKYVTLFKNTSSEYFANIEATDTKRIMLSKAPSLLSVKENDILTLKIYGQPGDKVGANRVYLNIEVVE